MGKGDKNAADGVAVDMMRRTWPVLGMRGTVFIGEGEKDDAPMLHRCAACPSAWVDCHARAPA